MHLYKNNYFNINVQYQFLNHHCCLDSIFWSFPLNVFKKEYEGINGDGEKKVSEEK